MEFKYRAADEAPSTFTVQSSNHGYFTEQAMRAGYMGRGYHGSPGFPLPNVYHQDPIAMREVMWRELEKEKIREEIIAEEIARRRMLEAEVRRELMIERESAMRRGGDRAFYSSSSHTMRFEPRALPAPTLFHRAEGRFPQVKIPMSFEERVGMSTMLRHEFGGFDSTLFQLQKISEPRISEVNPASEIHKEKEKNVILAKPETSRSSTKRKAETPPAVNTSELPSADSPKKKVKEEWSCAICQVSASSQRGLNDHLLGKKHKAKEVSLVKNGRNYSIGLYPKKTAKPNKLVEIANNPSSKQGMKNVADSEHAKKNNSILSKNQRLGDQVKKNSVEVQIKQKKQKSYRFWCETCKVGAFSEKVMEEHRMGKKHIAKLQEVNQNSGAEPTSQIVQPAQELMNLAVEARKYGDKSVSENGDVLVDGIELEAHQKEKLYADADAGAEN